MIHRVTANLVMDPAVATYQRRFRLEGTRLMLEGGWEYEGRPAVFTVTWERVE